MKGRTFRYPAKIEKATDAVYISFRDVPEVLWEAGYDEDIQEQGFEALSTALSYYFKEGREIPIASKPKKGEILIDLPLSYVSKIILHNTMLENKVRPTDLAKRLEVPTSEIARVTNPKIKTKIDTMALAVSAAGGNMQLAF